MRPAGLASAMVQSKFTVLHSLWGAVWQFRQRTLLATLLLVVAKITAVGVPLLLKQVVDEFSRPEGMATRVGSAGPSAPAVLVVPVFLLLSYALLRFAGTLFTELRDLVFARVTQWVVTSYAEKAFAHLLSLTPRFHAQRSTGVLIRDIERGTGGISFLLGAGLFTIVPTLVEFVSVLFVIASGYSLWFTVIIVLTFLVYASYTMAMTQRRELRQRRVNEVDSTAHGQMIDGLLNYETVKVHAREDDERRRYAEVLKQWVEFGVVNQRTLSTLHIGQSAIIAAGVALMMLLAGEQTVRGVLTVGDLVLVNAYVIQICLPLNALGFVFREARDALVNTEKLLDLLAQRPDIEERPNAPALKVLGGEVVFDHVDFAYEPGRPILQDISLAIGAGQTLAVVGGSGSGKSTLARLLLRMYDVGSGRISVDGQEIRSVSMRSLREAIGVVPQDTGLFNDTIAYNIGYGRNSAGLAEVIEAAKAAQVHEFIMSLPHQYETRVGERGTRLSGGEKQRIAIARAFLKNPPIMIFDEATSALDTRAERAIQNELDRIAQGRTTLIIAHRLSTIVDADHIVVMDKGRIVERGRHEALLQKGGLYAQLWQLQRQQQQFELLERDMARQTFNLAVLLAGVIDGLHEALSEKTIGLYTDIELENARVNGDPTTLAHWVRSILLRAIEATPPGGRLSLHLAREQGQARLTVTDGRQGLAQAQVQGPAVGMPASFDPLAVRGSMEGQGGDFRVEAPSANHGMQYIVTLPLHAIASELPPTTAADTGLSQALPTSATALAGVRVLAVDDLQDALQALDMLLRSEGAEVEGQTSARAVLSSLALRSPEEWPDVLLCDIALGDESGHELMRRIRALENDRGVPLDVRLPAIALSGFASSADRMHSMMSGFQAHLVKPVDPQELTETLLSVIRRPAGTSVQ